MVTPARKHDETAATQPVRLDKWLWAARFFKTRMLATAAVKGGKVHVNGRRAKASAGVRAGDRLEISKGEIAFVVDIVAVSAQRGPASQAEQLYIETDASHAQRQRDAEQRRAARAAMPRPARRPDKKQRRQIRRFKQGD